MSDVKIIVLDAVNTSTHDPVIADICLTLDCLTLQDQEKTLCKESLHTNPESSGI